MSTIAKQFQRHCREYMRQKGTDRIDPRDVAEWMIDTERWVPEKSALIRQCKDRLAEALRQQLFTDAQGRKVRAMHAIVEEKDGKQTSLWGDMRTMPREHMALSFQQRRRSIVSDCIHLKIDLDSYNDNLNPGKVIQMEFNFAQDLIEAEALQDTKKKNSDRLSTRHRTQSGTAYGPLNPSRLPSGANPPSSASRQN